MSLQLRKTVWLTLCSWAALGCLLRVAVADDQPETVQRPNVIVVLVDDMGYSDIGCYGGEIETPNIDALAAGGVRFTQFYNQGRCCPTRAALMTGLQPHQVGIGHMTAPPGKPLGITGPYQGYLNQQCATLAEVLKSAGYQTMMTGKWHLGANRDNCRPTRRGFDKFYGCISGAVNYFKPGGDRRITEGEEFVETDSDFYATDAFTDQACEYISAAVEKSDQPFFLYLAYNAPHWPLNAKWTDYQKYRGKYRDGWNVLMERRQQKQRQLGLFSESVKPAHHPGPQWDSLPDSQRDRLDAVMAAYAGCIDSIDQNIGKLMDHLKQESVYDNTIIFFLSDNGACQEGGKFGQGDEAMIKNPPLETTNGVRLGLHWAGACNTPFRKYKHFVHEGGSCTPLVVHWPAGIATQLRGKFIRQHAYLQDLMPTLMELGHADYPTDLPPLIGKSILPLLAGHDGPLHTEPIFFEHEGNAAIRDGDWKLVREYKQPWELYHLGQDRTELNDLANQETQRRDQMVAQWESWASQTGVAFPERFNMYQFLQRKEKQSPSPQPSQPAVGPKQKPAKGKQSDSPPDMVIFLSDDHTIWDSSLYGSPDLKTPNMDRIAAAGMTFDQAFVASPSCAPSRAALLTGLYPPNNGAEPNHSRPRSAIKKLPAYLQGLGYEVVAFGKVGHYRQTTEYGFDLARHFNYHEDVAIPKAIEWLQNRESDKPLCLFVGTNWPHVPWPQDSERPRESIQIPQHHVTTPETREARASYYEAVATMDRELGQVYDTAREVLGDDVFFMHTSDHGAQWPFAKWNLYDDGIRTPMVVSWPGRIQPGQRTQAMVSWIDVLPTLVEVAGGEPPQKIDGRSMLGVLTGDTDQHREQIFTTHSGDGSRNVFPMRSVRTGRWKYIRNLYPQFRFESHVTEVKKSNQYWESWERQAKLDPRARQIVDAYRYRVEEELFDLQQDPREQRNLASDSAHAEIKRGLSQQLDQWMQNTRDKQAIFGNPDLRALPRPPNVVMVFIDDMGWADLSCFGGPTPTPNIDRLASTGIKFNQFYVNSPICSSSRCALTTGHYPQRHRISSFLSHRQQNLDRGMANWLDDEAVTLPRLLQQQGYATGHFGKWHLGGQRDVGDAPLITEYGFDQSLTNFEGLGNRVLPLKDAYDGRPPRKHGLGSDQLGRGNIEWLDRSIITARFVNDAVEFVDQAQASGKPFYLNVWPDDVHSPFFPPQGTRGDNQKQTLYRSVLQTMDQQLNQLFARIENDPALRDNTLILIASDNGPEPGAGSAGELKGVKGELWEGGIRSPLIVWGPKIIAPEAGGSVNQNTVMTSIDLVASLITLCGLEPPESYQGDGEDLAGALLGYADQPRTTPVFWRRPPAHKRFRPGFNPDLAIRNNQWKLVCKIDGSQAQLYDLNADPGEQQDVAKKHPRIVNNLTQRVLEWNQTLPVDAVATEGDRWNAPR